MTTTVTNHPGEDTAGPITDDQHAIYDQIRNGAPTVLMSLTEKATGQQRAVIGAVTGLTDEHLDVVPVAILLDSDRAVELFVTPTGAVLVEHDEEEQSA